MPVVVGPFTVALTVLVEMPAYLHQSLNSHFNLNFAVQSNPWWLKESICCFIYKIMIPVYTMIYASPSIACSMHISLGKSVFPCTHITRDLCVQ